MSLRSGKSAGNYERRLHHAVDHYVTESVIIRPVFTLDRREGKVVRPISLFLTLTHLACSSPDEFSFRRRVSVGRAENFPVSRTIRRALARDFGPMINLA